MEHLAPLRGGDRTSLEEVIPKGSQEEKYLVGPRGTMGNCLAYRTSHLIIYLLFSFFLTYCFSIPLFSAFVQMSVCLGPGVRENHRETLAAS